jgi:hypothetical protein
MITTTVVWPQDGEIANPTEEERAVLDAMAETLSPDTHTLLTKSMYNIDSGIVATRSWPSTEIAQAWVDYVLANFDVTSAVINPE